MIMTMCIYAKVKRLDVICHFSGDRNEAEVVCFPEDIYSIEEVKQYSVDTIMQNFKGKSHY